MSSPERAVSVFPQHPSREVARSGRSPASSGASALLSAQRALGNQLIQRLLLAKAIQRQPLAVAPPEDEHEREADRVAELALRLPDPPQMPSAGASPETVWRAEDEERKKRARPTPPPKPPPKPSTPKPASGGTPQTPKAGKPPPGKKTEVEPPVPLKPPAEAVPPEERKKKEEEPRVAMKAETGATAPSVTTAVTEGIGARHGTGRPLGVERSFYEQRLGRDLSAVRVHDDSAAARAASDLGAKAFAYGEDVFFGSGRYQPHTPEGSRLLAHELVHTVQQRPGAMLRRRAIQRQADGATTAPPPGPAGSAAAPTALSTRRRSRRASANSRTRRTTSGKRSVSTRSRPRGSRPRTTAGLSTRRRSRFARSRTSAGVSRGSGRSGGRASPSRTRSRARSRRSTRRRLSRESRTSSRPRPAARGARGSRGTSSVTSLRSDAR